MPGMYLWNSHPKVYLPIVETGAAKCAYCGAEYVLLESVPAAATRSIPPNRHQG